MKQRRKEECRNDVLFLEDQYLTNKQISGARYHRNHRLMGEIYSDAVLPDARSTVTSSRVDSLRFQAQSLGMHQKKLEEEVLGLEAKYTRKRNQFLDDAERFRRELKRVSPCN